MNSNSNNGGPKRCNCKKSMCLKLYCECFAAGFFCDENCSCKECFNSTDYEDTVHEAREQVNLRYPDAFSPKIHLLTDSPTSQNGVAGKHTKGCNCKKSKCKKNYCECYQAKVGCSDGCRCEGCENAFGIRERYNVYRRRLPINNQFNECHTPAEPANSVRYPNAEFLNQFTPQNTPQFNATHPFPSLTDLPPLMDWSNNPTSANGNFSSLNTVHWPGSQVNRAPLMFGGPTETMHDYTTNLQNVYNKTIHETTKNLMQSMGSRFSLPFQQLGHENNPPLSESYIPSLDSANCDMMLDRQSYPSFEFLNRFTPPMTGGPDSSGSCGDYSSVNSWSGLQMTPVSVSSGPKVNNSNQEPSTCRRCDFISDAFS